jgi:toxin ParE1/3/4
LTEAWRWYEEQHEGLGDEFRACIDAALAEISRAPLMWPRVHGEVRRRVVRRFPYAVIYLAERTHVEVLAVFHASRDPSHWRSRV